MATIKFMWQEGISTALLAQCSSDGDSWYDTGSTDGSDASSAEQTEITLDERTGIWTGNE